MNINKELCRRVLHLLTIFFHFIGDAQCRPSACFPPYIVMDFPICACVLACDYIRECHLGYKWDFIECDCVVACPSLECVGNQISNYTTCSCDCLLTDADCSGPLEYLERDLCECRRYPCTPPWPCPEGGIIDWEICNCAPNPNYSTTKPPKFDESSRSSKTSHKKSYKSLLKSKVSKSAEKRSRSKAQTKCLKCKRKGPEHGGKKSKKTLGKMDRKTYY